MNLTNQVHTKTTVHKRNELLIILAIVLIFSAIVFIFYKTSTQNINNQKKHSIKSNRIA